MKGCPVRRCVPRPKMSLFPSKPTKCSVRISDGGKTGGIGVRWRSGPAPALIYAKSLGLRSQPRNQTHTLLPKQTTRQPHLHVRPAAGTLPTNYSRPNSLNQYAPSLTRKGQTPCGGQKTRRKERNSTRKTGRSAIANRFPPHLPNQKAHIG